MLKSRIITQAILLCWCCPADRVFSAHSVVKHLHTAYLQEPDGICTECDGGVISSEYSNSPSPSCRREWERPLISVESCSL